MKNTILILVLCGFASLANAATYTITQTDQSTYALWRTEANEVSAAIDLTDEGDFAQKPAAAYEIKGDGAGTNARNVQLIFAGGDTANETFSWKVYAWRNGNGPAELVAYGTGVLGSQAVVKYPHNGAAATSRYWADTLVVTDGSRWPKTVYSTDETGNNEAAKLVFATLGYKYFYVEITSADGETGSEAGWVSVYGAHFN